MIMVQLLSLLTGGGHQNVSVTLRSHVAADEESTEVTIPDTNSDIISQFQSLPPQAKEPASSASEEWPRLSGVQKVVVFSANANPFYSFYAPITAWAWKHLIGYAPVVLLSEDVHPFVLEKIAVCAQMIEFCMAICLLSNMFSKSVQMSWRVVWRTDGMRLEYWLILFVSWFGPTSRANVWLARCTFNARENGCSVGSPRVCDNAKTISNNALHCRTLVGAHRFLLLQI
jgi:hypothetical protein